MWRPVMFAVLAVVAADPGALLASPFVAPLTYSSAVLSPATTTITKQASSVVHPSPYLTYSTHHFGHFIKKRSAPLLAAPYIAPALTYSSPFLPAPYAAPALYPAAPVIGHAPLAYTHFIKKRSAPVFAAPYIGAPSIAYTPLLHSPYAAHLIPASQIYAPGLYRHPHVIKKRTLQLIASAARWFFGGNNNRGGGGGRNNNRW